MLMRYLVLGNIGTTKINEAKPLILRRLQHERETHMHTNEYKSNNINANNHKFSLLSTFSVPNLTYITSFNFLMIQYI